MQCRHFGKCGSCTIYDMEYEEQLRYKTERLRELTGAFFSGDIDIFSSPETAYRCRAEFRIWHEDDICSYAMGDMSGKGTLKIEECPKVTESISSVMWPLLDHINSSRELSHRLFGVEFVSSTSGECIVTMLYHRRLEEEWRKQAGRLAEKLKCSFIGRSRKQKELFGKDFVTQKISIDGKEYIYNYHDGAFIQPNPFVNRSMISWAKREARKIEKRDLLEAYCGLGNFTIPLSEEFDRVLATEVSKKAIKSAEENRILNNINNIDFIRLSSEELVQAMGKERDFRRLKEKDIDISGYDFGTVFVDPPRAGLDEATIRLVSSVDNIIYISCNPETLSRDMKIIGSTHDTVSAALFDQFPHTHHMECGVVMRRRAG